MCPCDFLLLKHTEQAMLAAFSIALRFLRALDGTVEHGHKLGAAAESIHGAALDQRLQHALVQQPQIYLLAEFVNRAEAAQLFACGDDGFDGVVADVLYRGQAEADRIRRAA